MDELFIACMKSLELKVNKANYSDYDEEEEEEEDRDEDEEEEHKRLCKVHVRNIPHTLSTLSLIYFLEGHIGTGSVALCEPCHQSRGKNNHRDSAFVHFHTLQGANRAIRLSKQGVFRCSGSKISIFPSEKECDRRKRLRKISCKKLKNCKVHMGCLVKENIFHSLRCYSNCVIEVEKRSKIFRIIVIGEGHSHIIHKLEWRFRDIHEVKWCKVPDGSRCFMLRAWIAPQVFRLVEGRLDDLLFNMDVQVWGRTVDFSDEGIIGQSFVYCLEVPETYKGKLDYNMKEFLTISEEMDVQIISGLPYSNASQKISPVLDSLGLRGLPFEIVFLVNSLIQLGYLPGPDLSESFFCLLRPSVGMPTRHICYVLDRMKRKQDTCFYPVQWLTCELEKFQKQSAEVKEKLIRQNFDDGLVMVRKVFVTPSRVYFFGPEVDVSNRVTRHFKEYIDDFIRVKFVEEDSDLIPSYALVAPRGKIAPTAQYTPVYDRIIDVMNNGITIGEKVFKFLAFSTSQLRENSAWMFSSNATVSAEDIRNWMGNFLGIRNVAKCAARMGQSFSSSTKSLDVDRSDVQEIPDIWNEAKTYRFSDGIGMISESFALKVAKKCRLGKYDIPSLYQIRYGGYKGVVAVNPKSTYKLSLRPSMNKFPSEQISLDILNCSRPIPCYLNREIITLLSTLGINDSVFEKKQELVLEKLQGMLKNVEVALEVLQTFSMADTQQVIIEMLLAGFNPEREPFLRNMLYAFRTLQVLQLQRKTRIFVPKGRLLMGCLDETKTLDYGQVFICVSPTPATHHTDSHDGLNVRVIRGIRDVPKNVCIVEGKVIVAKNPCAHPGDVRVLTAVDIPCLHHLVDCVVFPQQGPRSHPSECSGSDLDGDLYFVSWDQDLIPKSVDEPQDYQATTQSELYRPVTIEDIVKYFAEFMVNNSLGMLCNAHVVFADMEPQKARSPECLQLAKLSSIAVDFPKTGIPAVLPAELRPQAYPDFMEKKEKPMYKSQGIIGKLFRLVATENVPEKIYFTRREAAEYYDTDLELDGFHIYIDEALSSKNSYDDMLLNLMHQYDVKSEAEMFSGNILSLSKWYKKHVGDVKEKIVRAMKSLRKEVRSWSKDYNVDFEEEIYDDSTATWSYEELAKASAWYHVTYHPEYVPRDVGEDNEHLISFPWVVYDKLVHIKKMGIRGYSRGH